MYAHIKIVYREGEWGQKWLKCCVRIVWMPLRFFAVHLSGEDQYKDLWLICKLVFILSHGQSNIERGFSVNKEVLDDNMTEKSIVSQRLVYDTLASSNVKVHEFEVSQELRKVVYLLAKIINLTLLWKKIIGL